MFVGYHFLVLDNFPPMSGDVELHIGEHGHEVAVYCDYTGPIPASSIIETEWFVDGQCVYMIYIAVCIYDLYINAYILFI